MVGKKVELWVSVSGEISTKWRRSGPYEKPARGWLLVQTICRPFVSTRCWIARKRQYSFNLPYSHSIWNSNFLFPFVNQGHVRRILRGFVTISRRVFRFHPQSLESCTPETPGHETGRAIGRYRQGGRRCPRSYDGRQDGWDYESPSRPLRARLRCLVQSRPDVTPFIVGRRHDPAVEFADVDLPGGL